MVAKTQRTIHVTCKDISATLSKCPFCGAYDVELLNTWTPVYYVQCNECDAQGPVASSFSTNADAFNEDRHIEAARNAVDRWNNRHTGNSEPNKK